VALVNSAFNLTAVSKPAEQRAGGAAESKKKLAAKEQV